MKVYILIRDDNFSSSIVEGVFKNKKDAEKSYKESPNQSELNIYEYEVIE